MPTPTQTGAVDDAAFTPAPANAPVEMARDTHHSQRHLSVSESGHPGAEKSAVSAVANGRWLNQDLDTEDPGICPFAVLRL